MSIGVGRWDVLELINYSPRFVSVFIVVHILLVEKHSGIGVVCKSCTYIYKMKHWKLENKS